MGPSQPKKETNAAHRRFPRKRGSQCEKPTWKPTDTVPASFSVTYPQPYSRHLTDLGISELANTGSLKTARTCCLGAHKWCVDSHKAFACGTGSVQVDGVHHGQWFPLCLEKTASYILLGRVGGNLGTSQSKLPLEGWETWGHQEGTRPPSLSVLVRRPPDATPSLASLICLPLCEHIVNNMRLRLFAP